MESEMNKQIEIKINDRFDKLTNLDISTHYREREYYFSKRDFLSALGYWIITLSPYYTPNISKALEAFDREIQLLFAKTDFKKFTYDELKEIVSDKVFERIPEIEIFNHSKIDTGLLYNFNSKPAYDFIDLGALARNVFYMMLREKITQ